MMPGDYVTNTRIKMPTGNTKPTLIQSKSTFQALYLSYNTRDPSVSFRWVFMFAVLRWIHSKKILLLLWKLRERGGRKVALKKNQKNPKIPNYKNTPKTNWGITVPWSFRKYKILPTPQRAGFKPRRLFNINVLEKFCIFHNLIDFVVDHPFYFSPFHSSTRSCMTLR